MLQAALRAAGSFPAAAKRPRMHNRALHDTLAAFVILGGGFLVLPCVALYVSFRRSGYLRDDEGVPG